MIENADVSRSVWLDGDVTLAERALGQPGAGAPDRRNLTGARRFTQIVKNNCANVTRAHRETVIFCHFCQFLPEGWLPPSNWNQT